MSKIIQRLLLFFIGLPLLVILVFYLPQKNHLAINLVALVFSALGTLEFAGMLKKQGLSISSAEALVLGSLCPLAVTIEVSFNTGLVLLPAAFTTGAFWLLVSRVFSGPDKLRDSLNHITAGFAVMVYPGLFMVWLIRMAALPHADMVILVFLVTVIANDSVAWAAGMLFGRGNRGIIPASPNKSAAGFIGGFAAVILVGAGAAHFAPAAFTSKLLPSPLAGLILGLLSGAAATLGDLAESVMKRSSNIKDSGSIVPGRGGALDSIDSIALTAPVFYGLYRLLFC
ncbi:phosphatidate cytidylyltransferase [Spirochaetia bacterium]|nr:phosphatidate cytidylyltransferase [Spirochaetia bacterium]